MLFRLKLISQFCKITPQKYNTLFTQFEKTPKLETLTFSPYFKPINLLQIYNIVKQAKLKPIDKIQYFNSISQKLCEKCEDLEYNILANMCKDKSMIYAQLGQIPEAIVQIEKAIQAIKAMDQPFNVEVINLLQNAATLYLRVQNYPKSLKFLKDAEHLLNLTEQEILQSQQIPQEIKQQQLIQLNSINARLLSEFAIVHLNLKHIFQAKQYMTKALQRWKSIQNKNNLAYLFINKCKCILHAVSKQQSDAIQTAKEYLQNFVATQETVGHRLWFMKFLIDRNVDTYKQQLKQSIRQLSKVMPQKQLTEFLVKMGVIKKSQEPKKQKQNQKQNTKQKQ